MPARSNGLAQERSFIEVLGVRALPEFVGGEAIAVGGEGLRHGRDGVGRGEPGCGVEVGFYVGYLGVDCFGNEEVDAVDEVFDEALWSQSRVLWQRSCLGVRGR